MSSSASPWHLQATMLSWSVIEFGDSMPPDELRNSLVAVRWATDYLLKTVSQPDRIFVQVGDPNGDHNLLGKTGRHGYSQDCLCRGCTQSGI
uniref:cellulase n=1 Tax=Salix viminalis TaxID=40686 RepID=A0A6N2L7Z8_SALVM